MATVLSELNFALVSTWSHTIKRKVHVDTLLTPLQQESCISFESPETV